MNHEQIEQYLAGRMSESDARAFEDHCVAHPEFAKQVELDQRLKAGITQVARGSTEEFVRSRNPMNWQMAAAAAGILLSLLALLYLWQLPSSGPPPVLATMSAGEHDGKFLRLALVRGPDGRPALQRGRVRVEIAGLFDMDFHYSVELDRIDHQKHIETVASVHGVRPVSPVALEVLIDGDQLAPGSYSLRVRKQTSVEEPLDFEFLRR